MDDILKVQQAVSDNQLLTSDTDMLIVQDQVIEKMGRRLIEFLIQHKGLVILDCSKGLIWKTQEELYARILTLEVQVSDTVTIDDLQQLIYQTQSQKKTT